MSAFPPAPHSAAFSAADTWLLAYVRRLEARVAELERQPTLPRRRPVVLESPVRPPDGWRPAA